MTDISLYVRISLTPFLEISLQENKNQTVTPSTATSSSNQIITVDPNKQEIITTFHIADSLAEVIYFVKHEYEKAMSEHPAGTLMIKNNNKKLYNLDELSLSLELLFRAID